MRAPAVALLTSVLALGACAGGIDSAARADLDKRLAQLPISEETFPPSEYFSQMAFVVGQWTQHRIVDDKGQPSLLTSKLVGQESDGYWIEIKMESYYGREVVKMFVALQSGRDPAGMEIRSARRQTGDTPPVLLEGAALDEARKRYRGNLDLLAITFEAQEKDDAKVPAGRFIGCYTTQTPGPWGPWAAPAVVCSHPSVPLSGVVRAKPVGLPGAMELVAFGTSGAESEM
jgi:hypothetical protein